MRHVLPYLRPGMSVGLLGGSFDPPHPGHVHITTQALRLFGLDRVWWLVSPGNPLKTEGPAPMARRVQACRSIMTHPHVRITGLEAHLGTRATADTLEALHRLYPGVRFVWLMGADNLAQFHRWNRWRDIIDTTPIGVLARPGDRISARMSPAARLYAKYRIAGQASHILGRASAPAWCFVNAPMMDVSSTSLRANGQWSR